MDELKNLLGTLATAFEKYKEANDARLVALEAGGGTAEHDEKLARIEKEIKRLDTEKEALEAKMARPSMGGASEDPAPAMEHKAAFGKWLRRGSEDGLADLERKAMSVGSDEDGGYAVPETLSREIYSLLTPASPMRGLARVITVGGDYTELVNIGGTGAGWVGETAERTATDSPQFAKLTPSMGEVYAKPLVSQIALDDMFFNVESFLSTEIATVFAGKENAAFTTGDGSDKPKGLLAYPMATTADGTRDFGKIQYLKTGVADAFPAATPADILVDLVQALKAGHRPGAVWMMAGLTLATIRKWKDDDGNYLWQPGLQAGQPSTLLGYPVKENEDMPGIGANALCVVFGDIQKAYTVVDRKGIRMLRDPYSNKPNVEFYSTKRVGGYLRDSEAVKVLKCEE